MLPVHRPHALTQGEVLLDLCLLPVPGCVACASSLQANDVLGPNPLALELPVGLDALVVRLLTHNIT